MAMAVTEALERLKQELLEWNSATREQRMRVVNGLYVIAAQMSNVDPADQSVEELTIANLPTHLRTIHGVLFLPDLENDTELTRADASIVLRERHELEADDAQAKSDLRSAKEQLRAVSLDTTQAALRLIGQWTMQPTRFRSEFARLKALGQVQLVGLVEEEVTRLIRNAAADHYEYLDLEGVQALIEAAKRNASPTDGACWDSMLNSAALSITRAHRVEHDAKRDPHLWEIAKQQWSRAANLLGASDVERAYCELRAKQAHKQVEFLRAKAADVSTAISILRALCDDLTLCMDGDVWLHHGTYCLHALKDFFAAADGSNAPIGQPHEYALDARRSLQRAAQFQSTLAQATSSLGELELWERLIAVRHDLVEALTGGVTLMRQAYAKARAIVEEAGLPTDSDAFHRLQKLWNEYKKVAYARLERQYAERPRGSEERHGMWDRLDALLGMIALDPDDARSRDKLRNELVEARRQLVAEANRAYNDASAVNFVEQYLQTGNPPPRDEEVAQLQLEEVGRQLKWANNLSEALHAAAQPVDVLHQEASKLEGWQRDLRALINGLTIARHRATHGLREPEQLEVARYVLGISGKKPTTSLHQVPQMFVGHPSFQRCKAYVDECASQRKSQEQLFREVTLCLRFDAATTPERLDVRGTGEDFQLHDPAFPRGTDDLLRSLHNRLQPRTGTSRTYPIEVALEMLREMERAEPEDACGLQRALIYHDSNDHQREYRSLHAIVNVLQSKVRQVHILRGWLLSLTGNARLLHVGFPGVVDWEGEKKTIEALRDSGPHGLVEAQTRCRAAKVGTAEGVVQGLWSLERMRTALSEDSMMAHLRHKLAEIDAAAVDIPLCTPARAINHERHESWLTYERQVEDCDELARDIASRIERYASTWGEFDSSYRALMSVPFLRRRRITESAEWQQFQRAAERFCNICPNYDVFGVKLHEVQARFKLQPECLDERVKK